MKNRLIMKKPIYLISITLIISTLLTVLFFGTVHVEKEFSNKMIDISTSDIISISDNSAKSISLLLENSDDFAKDIISNNKLKSDIEKNLKVLLTKNIKYTYIIYKDENENFKSLVNTSNINKTLAMQEFDIKNPTWLELYNTKKPHLIKQLFQNELTISYLIPIIKHNEVQLVMVVDFAVEKVKEINNMIDFVKNSILLIITIVLVFLLVFIIQTVKYFLIKKKAFIDKLTGVYNRNYLQESKNFINLSEYIIAAVDIDYFKKINDSYGHDNGDLILKQVAQTIIKSIRKKDDIVIRYGGEEFLILARTKRNDKLMALNVLQRILTVIRDEKFLLNTNEILNVTVSIGVNLLPEESRTFSEAFKLADIALYTAKTKGRNQLEIYTNKNHTNDYLTINEIKEAIDENRVFCHYQSILDSTTQKIKYYEALLRIKTKDNKIIYPDKILPIVQGTFICRNLTKQVLKNCYKKLNEFKSIKLTVNLTPNDITSDNILNLLKTFAKDSDISNRLALEIVETEEINNYEQIKEHLLELKDLGYKIIIDDFGSGYSNFIYLTEIKTDFIKIDGRIINKILDDYTSYLVVKNIVNFAKEANIKIVAEFVSSKELYDKVKELKIDFVQGFLFSKPSEELPKN